MSDMDRAKWSPSFATPQNWPEEGKQSILLKNTLQTNKQTKPQTAHYPEVHYKLNNILQQFLYNALQIPRHFEATLLHHSDHTIYFMKPQVHWKLVPNETLSWCMLSSIFFLKQIHIFCEATGFLTYS